MGATKLPFGDLGNSQTPPKLTVESHVVDILGRTKGRDQPVMLFEKALQLISSIDKKTLASNDVAIFDPFCKAGEIILAAAFHACKLRLDRKSTLITPATVHHELYKSNRYYALAPDERHYLLSRRTFFGNEQSHNNEFTKNIRNGNYLSEIDGRLDLKKFREEFEAMIEYIKQTSGCSKIIAVGNPPYQEADGGFGKSASPIYNLFFEALMDNNNILEFILVIPSRWFSGGKGLNGFRDRIIQSRQVRAIKLFRDAREVFPTVDINGGVCFLAIDKTYDGNCYCIDGEQQINVDLSELDAIPDDLAAYSLIQKIKNRCNEFMSEFVMARNPFGITSTTLRNFQLEKKKAIDCMIKERKIIKIPNELVLKNSNLIYKYKVVVPAAVGGTKAVRDFLPVNQFFIVKPKVALAETYIIVGAFDTKAEAERVLTYVKTSFCRYFIGLRKITQHLSQDCWTWVPKMDFRRTWTDEALFDHFKLTQAERKHIKEKVQEWS